MKFLIAFACLVAVACAASVGDADAIIERSALNSNPDGSYSIEQKLSNGIEFHEVGHLKDLPDPETGKPVPVIVQEGSFVYTSPEGQVIKTTYVANEHGFQPVGDHLPVAPTVV